MSTPDNPPNPPAFPSGESYINGIGDSCSKGPLHKGATLLDFFAAHALTGIIGKAAFDQNAENMLTKAGVKGPKETEEFISVVCYDFAEAMLRERMKREWK